VLSRLFKIDSSSQLVPFVTLVTEAVHVTPYLNTQFQTANRRAESGFSEASRHVLPNLESQSGVICPESLSTNDSPTMVNRVLLVL